MPNVLDSTGLTVSTREELLDYFTTQFLEIYGSQINLESSTPDGQWINIMIQAILDLQDLLVQIYNSFDPDNAIGNVLDQRVTINGIQRQAATNTITPITLVNSSSVTLYGVDAYDRGDVDITQVYTISDAAGNLWQLQNSQLGLPAGTHIIDFQSAVAGEILTVPNTITIPVSIVLGVVSVNNPTSYTTLGTNEESDAALRVRRLQSVSLASQGYLAGLLAALLNVTGVTSAFVYENTTSVTDSDGVPGHSIWVIVAGTGADADIAQAIYTKRNAGCGMFGSTSYIITQVDGSPFIIYWDEVVPVNLFIYFTATSINGVQPPNIAAIKEGLVADYTPGVYEEVNVTALGTAVQAIDSNTLVTNAGFTTGETQLMILSGVPASGTFKLSYNGNLTASINWNDSVSTIQTKLQAVSGLSSALVTGSLASQQLTIDLSGVGGVLALIFATNNSLQTSAPAAITFSYDYGLENILAPSSKQNQFIISDDNIIILAMILSQDVSSVGVGESVQFTGLGGYGTYVYSFQTNNSGGSINASTGLYVAGATPSVIDTLKVTDSLGNTATATVSVT